MSSGTDEGGSSDMLTANLELTIAGHRIQAQIPVRKGPMRRIELLPVFQQMATIVIDIGVQNIEAQGEKVSCQKGCGACCRQLVPISEIEARHVRDLVNQMPEPRRSTIQARFAEARQHLQRANLLDKLLHPEKFPDLQLRPVGLQYFQEKIPCPFLEEESCSIHPDRPIACREYLVTSPAAHCAQPTAETVRCVPLPGKVSTAISRMDEDPQSRFIRWVPLILALDWAEEHPDESPPRPGPELLKDFFQRLTETKKEEEKAPP